MASRLIKRAKVSCQSSHQRKIEPFNRIEGLNAPNGMVIQSDKQFVSDKVVEIDLTATKVAKLSSTKEVVFLNDTAITDEGTVYVSSLQAGS